MGVEEPIISGAVKTTGFFVNPLSRINLIVTAIIFLILAGVGLSESFSQHSGYPFFSRALLPIVGADTSVGMLVDDLSANPIPHYDGFLTKTFPSYLWFWLKFWFLVVCNIWFIYFFIWLLYQLYSLGDNGLILHNTLMALGTFVLISLFVGMVVYNVRLSGLCLPDDRAKNFNTQMANTYPLHGVSKLAVRFVNKGLFDRITAWSDTGFGRAVSDIPNSPNLLNLTLNDTNVSVS